MSFGGRWSAVEDQRAPRSDQIWDFCSYNGVGPPRGVRSTFAKFVSGERPAPTLRWAMTPPLARLATPRRRRRASRELLAIAALASRGLVSSACRAVARVSIPTTAFFIYFRLWIPRADTTHSHEVFENNHLSFPHALLG